MAAHVVDTHEAKSRRSELIREVEQGGDVIVARNGQPVAKVIPWPQARPELNRGAWSGQVTIHHDIVGPDEDVWRLFEQS